MITVVKFMLMLCRLAQGDNRLRARSDGQWSDDLTPLPRTSFGKISYLVTGSLLQQHVAVFVKQEYAERPMEPNVVALDLVTVPLARRSNVSVSVVDEDAIFFIQEQLLLFTFERLGELVSESVFWTLQEISGWRKQLISTKNRHF